MHTEHSGHMHSTVSPSGNVAASHGMAVLGFDTIYVSHLPMARGVHAAQLIGQVSFGRFDGTYRNDRSANPGTRLYTFSPDPFVLSELLRGPNGEPPTLKSFVGSLVRNHFERPPAHPERPVEIASEVVAQVVDVVYYHKFDPHDQPLDNLRYILFGKGSEKFLAHQIIGPFQRTNHAEFDQLVSVDVRGFDFSDEQLRHGVVLTFADRPNEPGNKIREREKVAAVGQLAGHEVPVDIDVKVELYFETSDLKM